MLVDNKHWIIVTIRQTPLSVGLLQDVLADYSIESKSRTGTSALTVNLVICIDLILHQVERFFDEPCRPLMQELWHLLVVGTNGTSPSHVPLVISVQKMDFATNQVNCSNMKVKIE